MARPSALAVFVFHQLEFGRLLNRQIGRLSALDPCYRQSRMANVPWRALNAMQKSRKAR